MTNNIVTVISLSMAVGSASFLICKTEISQPVRVWVANRSGKPSWMWLSKLLQCPYCTGTWLSIFAEAIYRPLLVHGFIVTDYLVSLLVMNGVAMLSVLIIRKALGK